VPKSRDVNAAVNALRDLILTIEHYRQTVAHHLDVGVTETQALSNLAVSGSMGQTELADALGITTSSVTSLVDRMETAGLVTRQPHPHDRRRTVVRLTKYGDQVLDRSRSWMGRAFDEVGDAELARASQLLLSLSTNLRAATAGIR
jgi:DNA-binding MarR family transcriptional regulator